MYNSIESIREQLDAGEDSLFDEQPLYNAAKKDLDSEKIKRFFGETVTIPFDDLIWNTRITIRDENSIDRPTVAGLLEFSTNVQEYLSSAYYRSSRLQGL